MLSDAFGFVAMPQSIDYILYKYNGDWCLYGDEENENW